MAVKQEERGEFQVVFLPEMRPALEAWLRERGFMLFRIPLELAEGESEDLPTFAVGLL